MNFTDQLDRTIQLTKWPPQRIVSLTPSQTELLADLGLSDRVSAITKFCVHPAEWRREKTLVGGTKTLNLPKIAALQPDLIIGNKEENEREQMEWLADRFPVWVSDVPNLAAALDMVNRVGALTDKAAAGRLIADKINGAFDSLRQQPLKRLRVAYLIWRKPYMVAGGDTFIHDMLQQCALENTFGHLSRYPQVDPDILTEARPDCIFLSSEPYPFAEKHLSELHSWCPDAQLLLVDGEMFSWYGSRMLYAPAYFEALLKKLNG